MLAIRSISTGFGETRKQIIGHNKLAAKATSHSVTVGGGLEEVSAKADASTNITLSTSEILKSMLSSAIDTARATVTDTLLSLSGISVDNNNQVNQSTTFITSINTSFNQRQEQPLQYDGQSQFNGNNLSELSLFGLHRNVSTINVSNDENPQIPNYIRYTSMVFCILIMCLGVIGNVMVSQICLMANFSSRFKNVPSLCLIHSFRYQLSY